MIPRGSAIVAIVVMERDDAVGPLFDGRGFGEVRRVESDGGVVGHGRRRGQ